MGRKNELILSASTLGIRSEDVTCIDDKRVQDGMTQVWPTHVIAEYVTEFIDSHNIDVVCFPPQKTFFFFFYFYCLARSQKQPTIQVLTFDKDGVSQHPNHIAVHYGVQSVKHFSELALAMYD